MQQDLPACVFTKSILLESYALFKSRRQSCVEAGILTSAFSDLSFICRSSVPFTKEGTGEYEVFAKGRSAHGVSTGVSASW